MSMTARLVLFTCVMLQAPALVFAQAAPPPPREVSAELSFVGTSGNASTQSIGAGIGILNRWDPWEVKGTAAYVRNTSLGELKAESLAATIGGARILSPRVSLFVREGYLRDHFAGIRNRNTPEGGVSITALDAMPQKLVVDLGAGYANESRLSGENLSNGIGTLGALYTIRLSDTADISDDIRSVFSFSDGADRRFANVASLSAKLTTIFSLKLSNTVRFVNAPPPGFEKTDTITAIALVAKF